MAGRTIRICPPRTFNFSGLAAAQTQTITIAERIDCSQYDSLDLIVRVVGAVTQSQGSSSIKINVVSDGFTPDDPSQDYFSDPLATVTYNTTNGQPVGTTTLASTSGDLGSMLAVQIEGHADTAGTLTGRLSIDIVLKTN